MGCGECAAGTKDLMHPMLSLSDTNIGTVHDHWKAIYTVYMCLCG